MKNIKFLLILPALVLPFLTLFLWGIGLFKTENVSAKPIAKGLNTNLPSAIIKEDKGADKMSFYESAAKDSAKLHDKQKADTYYENKGSGYKLQVSGSKFQGTSLPTGQAGVKGQDEQKSFQKIYHLQELLHPKEQPSTSQINGPQRDFSALNPLKPNHPADPELEELNTMMDKILDMQHPERMKVKGTAVSNKKIFAVRPADSLQKNHGFYSLNEVENNKEIQNNIEAIIPETQTLVAGATVKILLASDIYVYDIKIPKNSFVYGIAAMKEERLIITIRSLRYQTNILPVSLEVYDMDGMEGIYIPGSVNREVVKESSAEALNALGITNLDPSLTAQDAGVGIQAAKSLLSRKLKLTKITLREGYHILLRDNSQPL